MSITFFKYENNNSSRYRYKLDLHFPMTESVNLHEEKQQPRFLKVIFARLKFFEKW